MYLGTSYRARERALQYLVSQKKVNDKVIMESSFTINYAISTKYCLNNAINLYRLQPLITSSYFQRYGGQDCRFWAHAQSPEAFVYPEWFGRAQKCFDRKN